MGLGGHIAGEDAADGLSGLERYDANACPGRRARLIRQMHDADWWGGGAGRGSDSQTSGMSDTRSDTGMSDTRSDTGTVIAIPAGAPLGRNYPANHYPYRASSHFLYFIGAPLPGACLFMRPAGPGAERDEVVVQLPRPGRDDALWHGETANSEQLGKHLGCEVRIVEDPLVSPWTGMVATLPAPDLATRHAQNRALHRDVGISQPQDVALRRAIIALRLRHDEAAIDGIRRATAATMRAHRAGMQATRDARWAYDVRAAMEGLLLSEGMSTAYPSIVTPHGEVLHATRHDLPLAKGDLLLCDVGAESHDGWAGDITRTWPVAGSFSGAQRDATNVVLAAQRAAIAAAVPGTTMSAVHGAAGRALVEGLVALEVLRGDVDDLFADNAQSLFFPHGVGHLLGLDVHDMEDLGDQAGYGDGRQRETRFGWSALRLNRTLEPGMVVTIEPGLYVVPALVGPTSRHPLRARIGDRLNTNALERLTASPDGAVRGIRIEDDVLITDEGNEVLTDALPKAPDEIEACMAGG